MKVLSLLPLSPAASSDDSCPSSDEAILREAGVDIDLASLTSVDGRAPLELVCQHHAHITLPPSLLPPPSFLLMCHCYIYSYLSV